MAARPGSTTQPVYASGLAGDRCTVNELLALIRRPAWQADALCPEYPEVNFFPERGESGAAARAVCGRCLVRPECLAFSLEYGQGPAQNGGHGVWAGTSARERRQLRPGVQIEAARHRAGAQEARRRRLAEQRQEISRAWLEDPGQSGRAVARAVGATLKLVLTVKRELEAAGRLEPRTPAA